MMFGFDFRIGGRRGCDFAAEVEAGDGEGEVGRGYTGEDHRDEIFVLPSPPPPIPPTYTMAD